MVSSVIGVFLVVVICFIRGNSAFQALPLHRLATTNAKTPLVSFQSPTKIRTTTTSTSTSSSLYASSPIVSKVGKVALSVLLKRGGGGAGASDLELAVDASEWCANLAEPAALVGGAVLATLATTREDFAPTKSDSKIQRRIKQATRVLLLTAFGLEIMSIFVTTVTSTMLLTQGDFKTGFTAGVNYASPMGFLQHNHEFEYLTARIAFLQGLFHWLLATGLEVMLPKDPEGESSRRMNQFMASVLVSIVLLILSFYNAHLTYYNNYFEMVCRYAKVAFRRYVREWRLRPLSFLYIPSFLYSCYLGWRALVSPPDLDNE